MAQLSDTIEKFIKDLMEEETHVELRRNELAQHFGCAPSQINYVLATRFSVDHGYVIESRRGGGGFVRIVRMRESPEGNLLGCYDKQALWGWDCDHFSRGAQPGVFDIGGVRVGFRICFDVRFPEPFRQLYRTGADLCIVCFSDTAEQPDRERYGLISAHLRTRAVENVMPILSVNSLSRCQTAPVCVIDPGGTVLLEAPTGARQLLVWDFSPAADNFGSRGRRVNSDLFLELSRV